MHVKQLPNLSVVLAAPIGDDLVLSQVADLRREGLAERTEIVVVLTGQDAELAERLAATPGVRCHATTRYHDVGHAYTVGLRLAFGEFVLWQGVGLTPRAEVVRKALVALSQSPPGAVVVGFDRPRTGGAGEERAAGMETGLGVAAFGLVARETLRLGPFLDDRFDLGQLHQQRSCERRISSIGIPDACRPLVREDLAGGAVVPGRSSDALPEGWSGAGLRRVRVLGRFGKLRR